LFSALGCFFSDIFILDNFLENSFVSGHVIFTFRCLITLNSGSQFFKFVFVLFKLSLGSGNFEP
jgi:hypothetical protein